MAFNQTCVLGKIFCLWIRKMVQRDEELRPVEAGGKTNFPSEQDSSFFMQTHHQIDQDWPGLTIGEGSLACKLDPGWRPHSGVICKAPAVSSSTPVDFLPGFLFICLLKFQQMSKQHLHLISSQHLWDSTSDFDDIWKGSYSILRNCPDLSQAKLPTCMRLCRVTTAQRI